MNEVRFNFRAVILLTALCLTLGRLNAAPETNRLRVSRSTIEISGVPGFTYQLQESPVLRPAPTWVDVGSALSVNAPAPLSWTFTATNSEQFFRVEIQGGSAGISQNEARVINEVIRPAEQTNLVLGLRWPTLLAAGAVIEPLSNADETPENWTVSASSELFVIDHAPAQKLAHPFTYVLLDTGSGAMQLIQAFYPPVVDGESQLGTLAQRWNPSARFYPTNFNDELPPLAESIALEIPDLGTTNVALPDDAILRSLGGTNEMSTAENTLDCTNVVRKKVAVVIASGADDEIQNDAREMGDLLTRLGFTVTRFNSSSNNTTQVANGIEQAGQGLGPCDKFFVYMSSHTQLVDENDDGKPDDLPIRLDYGLGHPNAVKWTWLPNRRGSFASALQAVEAGQVNIMLDTCFAEAFGAVMRRFRGELPTGVTWSIFASSSRTNTSAGATELDFLLDYGNDDANSLYTGKILEKVTAAADANQIDTDGDGQLSIEEIEQAFTNAQTAVATELANGQKPKFDQLFGPIPVAVGDTFVTPPGVAITNKVAANDTAPAGTQFVLVAPPAIHQDLYNWNPETGEMTLTGLSTISEVTFTYKLVNGTYETQPVTATVQFDARMNYAEEFLQSGPETVRVPCLLLDGLNYPVYQFRLANSPFDACPEPHWHANGDVFPLDVLNAPGRNDPNPPSCGFGTVKEVPATFLEVPKDVWAQFLIDHIPPIP